MEHPSNTSEEVQARLAAIVNSSDDAIVGKTLEGIITSWNPGAERMFGYAADEIIGKSLTIIFPPERLDEEAGILARVVRGESVKHYETVRIRKDGKRVEVSVSISPIRDSAGRIIGASKILRDITVRKQTEEALRVSEERARTILENMIEGCQLIGFDWRYLYLNHAASVQNRRPNSELLGRTMTEAWPGMEATGVFAMLRRCMEERIMLHDEVEFVFPDGHRGWFDVRGQPVPQGIFILSIDITERKRTRKELRKAKEQIQYIVDNIRDVVFQIDLKGNYIYGNPAAERLTGYPLPQLLKMNMTQLVVPEHHALVAERLQRRLAGETDEKAFEFEIQHKDGHRFWTELTTSGVYDHEQQLVAIQGVARDVTERKRSEELARKGQEQLQSLVEQAPISIAMFDREMNYIITSRHWITEYGKGHADLAGLNHYELHPDMPSQWKEAHQRGLAGEFLQNEEDHWLHPDGAEHWLRWTVQPWRDARDEIGGIIIFAEDITARKRAEETLRLLGSAVEQSKEAIVITDAELDLPGPRILFVNPAFTQMTGYSAEEAIGRTPRILQGARTDRAVLSRLRECLVRGKVFEGETINYSKAGKEFVLEWQITPIRDANGAVTHFVAIQRDITVRRKLEEQFRQAQKMEGIGQLAGGVAHDFNNILAVIQMQSELLKSSGNLNAEQSEFANEIALTVQRAAALTRQLLLFSRREVFQPCDLDLSESVTNTTKMLRRILGENVQVQLKLSSQPMFIHADAGMMDQILMNLCVNARDAMPNGGHLIIETSGVEFDEFAVIQSPQTRAGSFVRLSVSDSGCGIPPEILPKIFEPFFTTKDVGKGTGLGLATVFGIVQQHQGWINVYSEVNHGTTFRIYLPRLAKNGNHKSSPPALAELRGGKETILLVEDDPALRASVQKGLSQLGYRILEAPTGVKALDVWKQNRAEIRLLLTDLVMPDGMTGKDLGQRLLQEDPKLKVIYMSGYSAEIIGKDFPLKEGVNFLTKPFPAAKLAQAIRAALDA